MTQPQDKCPHCGKPAPRNLMGLCPECLLKAGMGTATGEESPRQAAGRFIPPTAQELAEYFPELEIVELIGRGGMGAVYKAKQKALDRVVALKILPPAVGEDQAFAQRFAREAKALAALSHPHIVTLYEFGEAQGKTAVGDGQRLFYFLMEYVDGVNLRQLMAAGKLAAQEALAIVPQICDALQYAHDRGIVHRDIKPENILLSREGVVKIADFGVAKIIGKTETMGAEHQGEQRPEVTGAHRVGTPAYMAPEQQNNPGEVDHRADIYSLGVVFYQMLTGELPGQQIQPPSRKVQIDVRLDEIVLRALEQEPERRYETAGVMRTVVETIAHATLQQQPRPAWHRLVAVVGTREGKPVVNWTGVAFDLLAGTAVVGIGGMIGVLLRGQWPSSPWPLISFATMPMAIVAAILIGFMRMPPERLVPLDKPGYPPASHVKPQSPVAFSAEPGMPPSAVSLRLSRTALIGTIWAPLFFIASLLWFMPVKVPAGTPAGPNWWQIILILTIGLPGLLAPFGTTLLGWIAVAQIRRSNGRLYGLGLAVFDGLFFPLLVLDGLIYGAWFVAIRFFVFGYANPNNSDNPAVELSWLTHLANLMADKEKLIALIAGTLNVLAIDLLLIRWVWRVVRKPLAKEGTPLPVPASPILRTLQWAMLGLCLVILPMAAYLILRVTHEAPLEPRIVAANLQEAIRSAFTDLSLRASDINVTISADGQSADVVLTNAQEMRGIDGKNVWQPVAGQLKARYEKEGYWRIWGTENLGHVNIQFKASEAWAVNPATPQTPRRVAEPSQNYELDREGETMQNIIFRLREKYPRLRFCLENLDFEVKDATTLGQAMKQLEAAAKVRKLSQNETQRLAIAKRLRQEGTPDSSLFDLGAYYEGKVAGASPEELLENLTRNTPYSWQKIGESYVVRPRGYTRLDFPVTLETNGLSLDEAIPKLLKQKPTGPEIGYGMIIAMPVTPGVDPFPWLHAKLPPLKLDKMTAMEALCRLSARARADCVWELAGYKDSRMLSVQVGRTPENKP